MLFFLFHTSSVDKSGIVAGDADALMFSLGSASTSIEGTLLYQSSSRRCCDNTKQQKFS